MRVFLYLIQKEFLQIFRNRAMLPILFVMPVVQLMVLSFAATFEVRNTPVSLVDEDGSPVSKELVQRFVASGYFSVVHRTAFAPEADRAMQRGEASMILHIPTGFEGDLRRSSEARVQITMNALDGNTAGVAQAYALQILERFNRDIQIDYLSAPIDPPPQIDLVAAHWYNPMLDYKAYMVPGILVILVTMIGTFLSAMNVVREKEIGTIEQLNVTPIRKTAFIAGKLLPFWIIAMVDLAIGLLVASLVFGVEILGNPFLVFALAGLYLFGMLGLGLWISSVTDTQQQAMFIAWFVIVIGILMSGLFTPIESMPAWAQKLTLVNPVAYFIQIMRRVLLKGAGIEAVRTQVIFLAGFAAIMMTLAVRRYRKTAA
jgi:ABC-2 type transport system permease protein